jgi:hypothetical protein
VPGRDGDEIGLSTEVGASEGFLHGVDVLFDAAHGQEQDRWSTIIADLEARGASVWMNFDPLATSALDTVDVLWFTDVPPPASITNEEVSAIAQWVRAGGGLLLEGDDDITIELYDRILAALDAGISYSIDDGQPGTSSGVYPHETTAGVSSVLFDQNGAHLSRVVSPATVLIDDAAGTPAAAAAEIGSGRVVALADELTDDACAGAEDNGHFANRVFGWLAGTFWASARPMAGTIPPGGSTGVDVTFDARSRAGGIYRAELLVESNDPAAASLPVSVTLGVTAAPDIAVSHASIDFGDVFTGVTATETLAVYNGGKTALTLYNIEVPGTEFSVDTTGFTLDPDQGRRFVVSIVSDGPGPKATTLAITSSDPDDALIEIPVSAEGFDPPMISVAPDSLHESRFGDETVTRTLTIANDGDYDLSYSIRVEDPAGDTTVGDVSLVRSSPPVSAAVPPDELLIARAPEGGAQRSAVASETAVAGHPGLLIFGDDFEDGDFEGWIERGTGRKEVTDQTAAGGTVFSYHEFNSPAGHFNGVSREFGAVQPAYISFYLRPGALFAATSYVTFYASNGGFVTYIYCSSSGRLCVNAGNPGENCSVEYDARRWYYIELRNIDYVSRTFDYHVDHARIARAVPFMGDDNHDIAGMFLYNYFENSQAWWDEIILASERIVTWMTLDPALGVVPPHSSVDVEVTFDATQLFTGSYERDIVITSNDPATPEERIPATFDVTAVPNLALSDTLLDFGDEVAGFSSTLAFTLINRSLQEILMVDNIVSDNPVFTANRTTATLGPGERVNVDVAFAPDAHGPFWGTLTIESNDRDEPSKPIALSGVGVDAPVLSMVPDTVYVELPAGDVFVESLLVSNIATNPHAADLEYSFWVEYDDQLRWLTLRPQVGTVAPGSTAVVTATFDATGFFAGDYEASIEGRVNVPNTGILELVGTRMHVVGSAHMALADTLDFGTTYSGFPTTRLLEVKNVGSAELVVTDIVSDDPLFTASPTAFTLLPHDSTGVAVTFAPADVGPVSAVLTITSNDTAGTTIDVALTADVLLAPAVAVSTDSIFASVRQTHSHQETITIQNEGRTDLFWTADLNFTRDTAPAVNGVAGQDAGGSAPTAGTSLMDVLWHGSHGPLGIGIWSTAISDINALGGRVAENTAPLTPALLEPYDILWLGDADSAFTAAERGAIVDWVNDGGSLLIEADNATAVSSYQPVLDALGSGIYFHSAPPPPVLAIVVYPHETTNGVANLQFPGPTAFIYAVTPPAGMLANGGVSLTTAAHATVGKGRIVVVTDWLFSDLAIHAFDNRRFMQQVFGWLAGTNWLSVTPLGGTVAAGAETDVLVTFDAGDLPTDDYVVQLDIASNDPARPVIEIPLVMRVVPLIPRHVDLALDAGLNLRSWNVELEAESTTTILSSIVDAVGSVSGFDGGGLTFDPSIPPRFNTLETMDHYHGYWFRMTEAATLSLDGVVFDHRTPLPLDGGYNLVGYFPGVPDSTAHAIASLIDNTEVVLGYDGSGLTFDPSIPPQFNTLQMMRPGFGYWIKLKEPDTLVYPDAPVAGAVVAASAGEPSQRGEDTPAASAMTRELPAGLVPSGEWISVWGDDVRIGGEPIDAGTVVSALDGDGTLCGWCVAHHPGQFGLMAVYRDDPTTDVDEGAGENEAITVMIGDQAFTGIEWSGMGAVIDFNEAARVATVAAGLPVRNDLRQNFPNPFNPTTTIAYDLASGEAVTLAIYDVQGKRVRELVNGRQPAGRHRVEWDGRDGRGQRVASGVYFYRLEAGAYTSTKKMVLLK